MRRLLVWWAALALALLAACGGDATSSQPQALPTESQPPADIVIAANETILIGISAALSGDQINLGTDIADAAELAVSDFGSMVAGRLVRVQRMDDECTNAEKAVSVAEELIADDTLYFKVDDANRSDFEERGTGPFRSAVAVTRRPHSRSCSTTRSAAPP